MSDLMEKQVLNNKNEELTHSKPSKNVRNIILKYSNQVKWAIFQSIININSHLHYIQTNLLIVVVIITMVWMLCVGKLQGILNWIIYLIYEVRLFRKHGQMCP